MYDDSNSVHNATKTISLNISVYKKLLHSVKHIYAYIMKTNWLNEYELVMTIKMKSFKKQKRAESHQWVYNIKRTKFTFRRTSAGPLMKCAPPTKQKRSRIKLETQKKLLKLKQQTRLHKPKARVRRGNWQQKKLSKTTMSNKSTRDHQRSSTTPS